ncbi:MAG: glycosyltransferase family 4 protein [Acidobacteria bacterium]|nr:glycosyltransferase family 4 protein [Acidobacteriota bacterium]
MLTNERRQQTSALLPRLLMVSSFLSHKDGSHSVAQDLADRLRPEAEAIFCVSSQRSALLRGLDMATTTLLHSNDYDVAIVGLYSGRAFLWGEAVSWLLEKLGKPFVISMHGGALPEFAKLHPNRVAKTLSKAAAVTAPSSYLAELMQPYRKDILLLPNPIEISRYEFRLREQAQPKLIWLRSFHQIYNPQLTVKAAALLRDEFPDLHLTMIGPDKGDGSRQQTEQLAKELQSVSSLRVSKGLSLEAQALAYAQATDTDILITGGIANSEVPTWLNRGDIFINTTNVDNTPVSVIEAMACGLPIVSTNVGGLPYLLTDGEDALLVPPDNAEAMATAARRILTEAGLAERLSRNARRKAESFDWANVLPMWRNLIGKVR